MELKNNRTKQKSYDKPHISINYRGHVYFNQAYMKMAKERFFDIEFIDDTVVFNHEKKKFNITKAGATNICYNRQLGIYLNDKIGNDFFPNPDMFGSFTATFKKVQKLSTIKLNDTEYSITGAKNYINTLKNRALSSHRHESRITNEMKYKYALNLCKKAFPNEFNHYSENIQ